VIPEKLSVILPVYNEIRYFPAVMDKLLNKQLAPLRKEIIIVESRSTDGTHEAVKSFGRRPGVIVVYEDGPGGKGRAVRAGLARATGDIVLIQDADLEYDIDDYDALLEPLVRGRARFVLGSRYNRERRWRIRNFGQDGLLALLFNAGHVMFTALFNLLYGLRLKDPTTMFKVFTRDCLAGLRFECRRFDFDWELLAKLVRRGIIPLEIPVSYAARRFSEGKKIRLLADPLTWLRAIVKYRYTA